MTAKQEAERLMNALLPFGQTMLSTHGEFLPYGGLIKKDGRIVEVGAVDRGNAAPMSATLKEIMEHDFCEKARREEIIASAIVFIVSVTPPHHNSRTDAIQIHLDHKDGYSAEVFLPFRVSHSGAVSYE